MNKNKLLSAVAGLFLIVTISLGGIALFGRSKPAQIAIATPTVPAVAQATSTVKVSATPEILAALSIATPSPVRPSDTPEPPSATPSPVPATDTATAVPVANTATPTPAPAKAQASTSKPAAQKPAVAPAKSPTKDPNLLPNGVRYGDHYPNLPDRVVRIASPNIKLDCKVYEVYAPKGVWEVADYAAGHNYNSANPGEGGNVVLAGHNNWRGEVFRYLEFLKPGDEIDVWNLAGKEFKYKVESIQKLKEAGATMAERIAHGHVMDPTPYEQLTLITCWPYTTYTHRLIVTAKPMQ